VIPDIPYSKLKVFYFVARYGNYKRAASELYITQGAISQQLRDLEQRLGKELLDKSSRKTLLTPDGVTLYNLIAPLVEKCETIPLEFQRLSGRISGKVKIATWTGMLLYVLPDYIGRFRTTYPECDLVLFNISSKDIRSMILSGEADFGIGSMQSLPADIVGHELWRFNRGCVFPLDHPLSKLKKVGLDDMARYPIVIIDKGGPGGQQLENILRECNPDLKVSMETTSWEVALKYVELGIGVSMCPEIVIRPKDRKRIRFYNMSDLGKVGFARHGVLIKKGKYLSPAAKEFIKFLSPDISLR
jgi:DNA-binding transcriptional LysR family regulator